MERFVSGPMFEPADGEVWKSLHHKNGAHYNGFVCSDADGMNALREFFPDAKADEMNFVLFSTSGVHGTYATIEEFEGGEGEDAPSLITFLIVQPRICCLRHGNCRPVSDDDIAFIKELRSSSWGVVKKIGAHNSPKETP